MDWHLHQFTRRRIGSAVKMKEVLVSDIFELLRSIILERLSILAKDVHVRIEVVSDWIGFVLTAWLLFDELWNKDADSVDLKFLSFFICKWRLAQSIVQFRGCAFH